MFALHSKEDMAESEQKLSLRSSFSPFCHCISCDTPALLEKRLEEESENPQAAFWRHRWQIPGPGSHWTISGHSRSRERTGFMIEEPRLFLDAGVGWRSPTSTPAAVFVTHGHIDHINALPMLLRCNGDPLVFVPREHLNGVREMCRMTWSVKRTDGSTGAGQREDLEAPSPVSSSPLSVEALIVRDWAPDSVKGRAWVPVIPGLTVTLTGEQNIAVQTVRCYHSVADIGYILGEMKRVMCGVTAEDQAQLKRLMENAQNDRQAGKQIGQMRRDGKVIEREEFSPKLAFLCDTTVQVFGPCPSCAASHTCPYGNTDGSPHGAPCDLTPGALQQPDLIFACPTIIVECTFLAAAGMSEKQSQSEAMSRGHVSWSQLQPLVLAHPENTFALVHFSGRYTDAQIRSHFAASRAPRNVVLWLDSGVTNCADLPGHET